MRYNKLLSKINFLNTVLKTICFSISLINVTQRLKARENISILVNDNKQTLSRQLQVNFVKHQRFDREYILKKFCADFVRNISS